MAIKQGLIDSVDKFIGQRTFPSGITKDDFEPVTGKILQGPHEQRGGILAAAPGNDMDNLFKNGIGLIKAVSIDLLLLLFDFLNGGGRNGQLLGDGSDRLALLNQSGESGLDFWTIGFVFVAGAKMLAALTADSFAGASGIITTVFDGIGGSAEGTFGSG